MSIFLSFETSLNSTASMTLTWSRHSRHLMLDMMRQFRYGNFPVNQSRKRANPWRAAAKECARLQDTTPRDHSQALSFQTPRTKKLCGIKHNTWTHIDNVTGANYSRKGERSFDLFPATRQVKITRSAQVHGVYFTRSDIANGWTMYRYRMCRFLHASTETLQKRKEGLVQKLEQSWFVAIPDSPGRGLQLPHDHRAEIRTKNHLRKAQHTHIVCQEVIQVPTALFVPTWLVNLNKWWLKGHKCIPWSGFSIVQWRYVRSSMYWCKLQTRLHETMIRRGFLVPNIQVNHMWSEQ